jgi:hypothetical protein
MYPARSRSPVVLRKQAAALPRPIPERCSQSRRISFTSQSRTDAVILLSMPSVFRNVDPRALRVPSSRPVGADPVKLQRQIAKFGASSAGMPSPWVYEGTDRELVLFNGVTRATRIAKLAPGTLIRVEVIGKLRAAFGSLPTIGDLLP